LSKESSHASCHTAWADTGNRAAIMAASFAIWREKDKDCKRSIFFGNLRLGEKMKKERLTFCRVRQVLGPSLGAVGGHWQSTRQPPMIG
jgi:hypothetical protein